MTKIRDLNADLKVRTTRTRVSAACVLAGGLSVANFATELQDVPRQVLVFHDVAEGLAHVVGIDGHALLFHVGSLEADLIQHTLHDGMQTACADVLRSLVDFKSEVRDFRQCFRSELQLQPFGVEQRNVLLGERRLRLGEDLDEVFHRQRLQLHADGEAPLQFGDQVARLGNVECTGGDEQDVVGAHHAVARVHRGAFDDGQNVALHAFARNVRPVPAFASRDLVDFVEEDDARVLHALHGDARDLVHVDQTLLFFLDEVLERLADLHLPLLGALAEDVGQHVFHVDVHLLDPLIGDDLERRHRFFADVEFDDADAVHLVDKCNPQHADLIGLAPDGFRLRLDAADRAEHRDRAVEHAQRALVLDCEIDVSRRVDNIDAVVAPETGGRRRGDRDAALLLLHHPVHRRGAFVDLADLVVDAGIEEHTLGGGGLAGIDVRHDADIAHPFYWCLTSHLKKLGDYQR